MWWLRAGTYYVSVSVCVGLLTPRVSWQVNIHRQLLTPSFTPTHLIPICTSALVNPQAHRFKINTRPSCNLMCSRDLFHLLSSIFLKNQGLRQWHWQELYFLNKQFSETGAPGENQSDTFGEHANTAEETPGTSVLGTVPPSVQTGAVVRRLNKCFQVC